MYTHKHIKSLMGIKKKKKKKTYTSIKIYRNYSEQGMKIYCAFNILQGTAVTVTITSINVIMNLIF